MADFKQNSFRQDVANFLRGMLMGGADVIPGVSGGTVALVVGIYERLVTAISHCDLRLLTLLRQRNWKSAAAHIDLRFLLALGVGILLGIVTLGSLMNELLTTTATRSVTLAAFLGAILSSCVIVFRMVRWESKVECGSYLLLALVGLVCAYVLTTIPTQTVGPPSYGYIFFCGMIAICAMILPGISGAFILLILGVYVHLTDYIKEFIKEFLRLRFEFSSDMLITVIVFAAGCAIGLLSFSKILRWLLAHYQSPTMAVMCGLMLGSLNKIWPFQKDLTPGILKVKHKHFENFIPPELDAHVMLCIGMVLLAGGAVLMLDRFVQTSAPADK